MPPTPDVIDEAASLASGTATHALRRERPEIVRLSQTSFEAALRPRDPGNFSPAERAALAERMAHLFEDGRLAALYAGMVAEEEASPALRALADLAAPAPSDPRLTAILRHVDLVTLTPEAATVSDIERLGAAGLTDRDIVTLAGLIAFVNYQIRVAAGLRMLEARP
jgi:CMD domain protein